MAKEPILRAESHSDSEKSERLLYHYTDQNGLLGILGSKSIWATHVRYMNDASEFIHGINIARQCIKEAEISLESVLRDYPDGALRRHGSHKVWDILSENFNSSLVQFHELPVYVAWFFGSEAGEELSESRGAGDNLGQWRAYSKGSTGFSIGFERGALEDHIKMRQTSPEDLLLFGEKCIYDEEEKRETFKQEASDFGRAIIGFIKQAWEEFDENRRLDSLIDAEKRAMNSTPGKINDSVVSNEVPTIADILRQRVPLFSKTVTDIAVKMAIPAVFMKHSAFCDENEWRIAKIFGPEPAKVSFRPGKSSLIPYIQIPLPILNEGGSSLIRRIFVGPSPEIENSVTAVKMLLTSKGYKIRHSSNDDGIEILPSEIPYRDW